MAEGSWLPDPLGVHELRYWTGTAWSEHVSDRGATSIDALAVGIGFAFLDVSIVGAAVLIGVVTFLLSLGGVVLGHRAGQRWRRPAEVAGGLVLIAIGIKIVLDHTGVL